MVFHVCHLVLSDWKLFLQGELGIQKLVHCSVGRGVWGSASPGLCLEQDHAAGVVWVDLGGQQSTMQLLAHLQWGWGRREEESEQKKLGGVCVKISKKKKVV